MHVQLLEFGECRHIWINSLVSTSAMGKRKSSGRGGARNFPKKDVDPKSISEALTFYVKDMGLARAFDLSPYGDSMTKSAACSGKGLVKCSKLVSALHALEPTLSFKFVHLKEGLQGVGRSFGQELTGPTLEHWSRTTADTVLTVLSHTRRLKDETRYQEAGRKLTVLEMKEFEKLRALVVAPTSTGSRAKETSKAQEAEEEQQTEARSSTEEVEEPATCKERQDHSKQAAKTTTEDKAHFKMISSMEVPQTPPLDGYSQEADCCSPVPTKKAVLKQQIGILKKPASSQARFLNVRTSLPAFKTA